MVPFSNPATVFLTNNASQSGPLIAFNSAAISAHLFFSTFAIAVFNNPIYKVSIDYLSQGLGKALTSSAVISVAMAFIF